MIVKTRHNSDSHMTETYDPGVGRARGVLRRPLTAGSVEHLRRSPSSDVSQWIAHYWGVRWSLPADESYTAETLPHPSVHMIFEKGHCMVSGPHTRKFSRTLRGQGEAFGIKFKPGRFRPFAQDCVSKLANQVVPARCIFGESVEDLKTAIFSCEQETKRVEACNNFFRACLPRPCEDADLAERLVEQVSRDAEIKAVNDLAARSRIGKRSLQRLFNEYVGVSPKWVIRRYRLHELVEKVQCTGELDWAQVALDLGYFDQAHLINDFRSMVGYSPTRYRKLTLRNT